MIFGGRPSTTSASTLVPESGPSLSVALIVGPLSFMAVRPVLPALTARSRSTLGGADRPRVSPFFRRANPVRGARKNMDDEGIRKLVARLSRPHRSGGDVIERAAIMAEGADFDAVVAWIVAYDGEPESAKAPKGGGRGLHGLRMTETAEA